MNPEKYSTFGKNIPDKFGKQTQKNTPDNSEKYSPKFWFPEAKSLFPTMCPSKTLYLLW